MKLWRGKDLLVVRTAREDQLLCDLLYRLDKTLNPETVILYTVDNQLLSDTFGIVGDNPLSTVRFLKNTPNRLNGGLQVYSYQAAGRRWVPVDSTNQDFDFSGAHHTHYELPLDAEAILEHVANRDSHPWSTLESTVVPLHYSEQIDGARLDALKHRPDSRTVVKFYQPNCAMCSRLVGPYEMFAKEIYAIQEYLRELQDRKQTHDPKQRNILTKHGIRHPDRFSSLKICSFNTKVDVRIRV